MVELLVGSATIVAASVSAALGYYVAHKRQRADASSELVDDALQIKNAWREMYAELEEKVDKLDREMDMVIRKGEMWRGVAAELAIEYKDRHGTIPKAWPSDEPFPGVA